MRLRRSFSTSQLACVCVVALIATLGALFFLRGNLTANSPMAPLPVPPVGGELTPGQYASLEDATIAVSVTNEPTLLTRAASVYLSAVALDQPDRYREFLESHHLALAPPVNGEQDFGKRWQIMASMYAGADIRWSQMKWTWTFRGGVPLGDNASAPETNRASISRLAAGQVDLDPAAMKADAIDLHVPGKFFSAFDRQSRFEGELVVGFAFRPSDRTWIPYKAEITGWPVGIRIVHPPL